MSTPPKMIWLYWWTTISAMHTGSFVRTTYSSRRLSAAQVTAYDRANGWPVSKVKRMKVQWPGEPTFANNVGFAKTPAEVKQAIARSMKTKNFPPEEIT